MSEEKEYPNYNINVGAPTKISCLIEIKTYKYHPYGLEGFRKDLVEHVDEWQSRGLSWGGHDQLTHAWRTPWDLHVRYEKLMSPIVGTVLSIANSLSPKISWFLKESWVSEYTRNSGANKHNHGDDTLGWSFCYYVKMPDTGPAFGLCDDIDGVIDQVNVAEGDLLFFRHPQYHQVFPSVERRIIISGNIIANDADSVLLHDKYYNENLHKTNPILSANHHDIDIDNWNLNIMGQKLGISVYTGYTGYTKD